MAYTFAVLLLLPVAVALGFCVVNMFMWFKLSRGTTVASDLLVGSLGIFSVFIPKVMPGDARRCLVRFAYAFLFLAVYCVTLVIVFGSI